MENDLEKAVGEAPAVTEAPEFKAVVAQRDEARAKIGCVTADLDKSRSAVAILTQALKEVDAEERLKERNALRKQMGEAMSRAAALLIISSFMRSVAASSS